MTTLLACDDGLNLGDFRRILRVLDSVVEATTGPDLCDRLVDSLAHHFDWPYAFVVERPDRSAAGHGVSGGRQRDRFPRAFVEEFIARWHTKNAFPPPSGDSGAGLGGGREMVRVLIPAIPIDHATLTIAFADGRYAGLRERLISYQLGRLLIPSLRQYFSNDSRAVGLESLTQRELQIADLVATGLTNQEIAEHLHVTVDTVKKHISRALRKTSCTSRTQLAVLWR
ncbi:helix-turn-helix transcriptional regulator [Actinoallomurus vinaceus]